MPEFVDHRPLLPLPDLRQRYERVELVACQRRARIHAYAARLDKAYRAGAAMRRGLRRIQSAAGHPDPAEACRLALKIAAEALAAEKAARLA